jgi:DnaJ homolog subfamily A member 5
LLGMFGCPLCVPQSEKQLHNHEKSKKHLEALARLREQFLDEDAEDEAVPMPPSDDETTADGVKELGFNEVYCSDEERTAEAIESPQVEPPVDNQQSSSDSEDDVTTSAPSAPTEPKLTAKQKREARRAKKAVKAEKAAASAKVEDDDGVVACAVCHESFSSRNKRGWTSRY